MRHIRTFESARAGSWRQASEDQMAREMAAQRIGTVGAGEARIIMAAVRAHLPEHVMYEQSMARAAAALAGNDARDVSSPFLGINLFRVTGNMAMLRRHDPEEHAAVVDLTHGRRPKQADAVCIMNDHPRPRRSVNLEAIKSEDDYYFVRVVSELFSHEPGSRPSRHHSVGRSYEMGVQHFICDDTAGLVSLIESESPGWLRMP
jgi:hypothetical protein